MITPRWSRSSRSSGSSRWSTPARSSIGSCSTSSAPAVPDLLETRIPSATDVERMGVHRAPVASYAPTSRAAKAYAALWAEITARL